MGVLERSVQWQRALLALRRLRCEGGDGRSDGEERGLEAMGLRFFWDMPEIWQQQIGETCVRLKLSKSTVRSEDNVRKKVL